MPSEASPSGAATTDPDVERPEAAPEPDPAPTGPEAAAPEPDPATSGPGPDPSADEPDACDDSRPDADVDESADPSPVGADDPPPAAPQRRVSVANAVIALLLGLLGFALVVQLRSTSSDPTLAAARPDDLVRILSDLDARQDRLRQEIASLQDSQRRLASGAQGRQEALAEARRRADELGVLAGTLPAHGPGLTVVLRPGTEPIPARTVLDTVEELRGAGAEAMQIDDATGTAVRVVASTSFVDGDQGLVVDGRTLTAPYTISVIGDAQTMRTALNIPGGVVDSVRQHGGTVIVQEPGTVKVTALHQVSAPRYARPVS
ncbi:MAG TPA: DUF881 domain-containing protein [Micromonosporaceae bacterium]